MPLTRLVENLTPWNLLRDFLSYLMLGFVGFLVITVLKWCHIFEGSVLSQLSSSCL